MWVLFLIVMFGMIRKTMLTALIVGIYEFVKGHGFSWCRLFYFLLMSGQFVAKYFELVKLIPSIKSYGINKHHDINQNAKSSKQ